MQKIDFISEFNHFMRYAKEHALSVRERMLYVALLYIAYNRAVQDGSSCEFEVPDRPIDIHISELKLYSHMGEESIRRERELLAGRGLIDYAYGECTVTSYRIHFLSMGVGQ